MCQPDYSIKECIKYIKLLNHIIANWSHNSNSNLINEWQGD